VLVSAFVLDELVSVIRAQLAEGGPARTLRHDVWRSLQRRYARALTTWNHLVERAHHTAGLETRERSALAIEVVMKALLRRLRPEEARRLVPRLPVLLRARLSDVSGPEVPPRDGIDEEVADALAVDLARAEAIIRAVASSLAPTLRASDAVGRRLPGDLRSLLFGHRVESGGGKSSRVRGSVR
jgi:uncharacterized protein (DUF2267 family)